MSETNLKIYNLILQNKSIKQIAKELELTEKQIYCRIKQIIKKVDLKPQYYYDSEIRFKEKEEEKNKVKINLNGGKQFRCLAISDIHIGNIDSDIALAYDAFEYATKNGIHNILNCGDFIEGEYTQDSKSINSLEHQIEYLLKKYPYDKNINTFAILGNHDYRSYNDSNIDIKNKINNARYDIKVLGYGKGLINVGKDNILLSHKLGSKNTININENYTVELIGHGHMMKTKAYEKFKLCVPTLSYVSPDKTKKVLPGFIDLKIDLQKDHFEFLEAKHLIFDPILEEASKSCCRIKKLYYNKR